VLLQHLLILIQNRLIELDFSILVDSLYTLCIESILLGDRDTFLQPTADRLPALCDFDVDNLFVSQELFGLWHETSLRIHTLHVGLPGEDE